MQTRTRLWLIAGLALPSASAALWAAPPDVFYDRARVVDVQPVTAPRDVEVKDSSCLLGRAMPEDIRSRHPGVTLGAAIRWQAGAGERCREKREQRDVVTGYSVTYVYDGREYRRVMTRDPGDWIRVRVEHRAR